MEAVVPAYPVQFDVAYPERELDRLSTAFRVITVIRSWPSSPRSADTPTEPMARPWSQAA